MIHMIFGQGLMTDVICISFREKYISHPSKSNIVLLQHHVHVSLTLMRFVLIEL